MAEENYNVKHGAEDVQHTPVPNVNHAVYHSSSRKSAAVPMLRLVVPPSTSKMPSKIAGENSMAAAGDKEGGSEGQSTKSAGPVGKIFRNPRNLAPGSHGTHRPIGPRGSIILESDNTHLDRTKAVVGVVDPKKMIIRFKDTNGNMHEHKFPGHHAKKWDNEEWIKSMNKWRYQTVNRKFKKDKSILRVNRGRWSLAEKNFVRQHIQKRVGETGDTMSMEDWKTISKAHKQHFEGKIVKKGDALLDGAVAKKDYSITERSHIAMRAAYEKMGDLKEMVNELVAQFVTDDESSGDEDAMQGVVTAAEEEYHGGEIDHHLEDPSDDEYDDQRPAANPTGVVLVSVS